MHFFAMIIMLMLTPVCLGAASSSPSKFDLDPEPQKDAIHAEIKNMRARVIHIVENLLYEKMNILLSFNDKDVVRFKELIDKLQKLYISKKDFPRDPDKFRKYIQLLDNGNFNFNDFSEAEAVLRKIVERLIPYLKEDLVNEIEKSKRPEKSLSLDTYPKTEVKRYAFALSAGLKDYSEDIGFFKSLEQKTDIVDLRHNILRKIAAQIIRFIYRREIEIESRRAELAIRYNVSRNREQPYLELNAFPLLRIVDLVDQKLTDRFFLMTKSNYDVWEKYLRDNADAIKVSEEFRVFEYRAKRAFLNVFYDILRDEKSGFKEKIVRYFKTIAISANLPDRNRGKKALCAERKLEADLRGVIKEHIDIIYDRLVNALKSGDRFPQKLVEYYSQLIRYKLQVYSDASYSPSDLIKRESDAEETVIKTEMQSTTLEYIVSTDLMHNDIAWNAGIKFKSPGFYKDLDTSDIEDIFFEHFAKKFMSVYSLYLFNIDQAWQNDFEKATNEKVLSLFRAYWNITETSEVRKISSILPATSQAEKCETAKNQVLKDIGKLD